MNKKLLKSLVSTTIVVAFILLAVWYVVTNWHEFATISITDPLFLIPAVIFSIVNIYGSGAVIDLAIEPHGVKLTRREAFGLANITRFSNQFSPSYVGAAIRASYLKRVYGVSYTKFSSSFLVSNLLQFMISGILILVIFLILVPSPSSFLMLSIIGAAVTFFFLTLYMPLSRLIGTVKRFEARKGKLEKIFERLGELLSSYVIVRKYPRFLPRTIAWLFVTILSSSLIYFFIYKAIGIETSIMSMVFMASLTSWTTVFAVTPGSIGIREGLMVLSAQAVGLSIPATLLCALVLRLLVFITSGALSFYFSRQMLRASIFSIVSKSR